MGVFVLIQELFATTGVAAIAAALVAVAAAVCWFTVPACPLRSTAATR